MFWISRNKQVNFFKEFKIFNFRRYEGLMSWGFKKCQFLIFLFLDLNYNFSFQAFYSECLRKMKKGIIWAKSAIFISNQCFVKKIWLSSSYKDQTGCTNTSCNAIFSFGYNTSLQVKFLHILTIKDFGFSNIDTGKINKMVRYGWITS